MSSLSWYINLYYKFREYPIAEINAAHKPNELRSLYTATLKKLFTLFQLDNRRDGQIEGLISKNNYDHILNKKAETNLEQQPNADKIEPLEDNNRDSFMSRNSLSSADQKDSNASLLSQDPRWLVQADPHQRNMDVFYELMIKMIRISLRRLTIEAFALERYGKNLTKESVHEIIKNNSEYSEVYSKMQAEGCIGSQSDPQENTIKGVSYPSSVQQLKYEFLKYCITCKIYNNPIQNKDQSSQSLVSYQSSVNTSSHEEERPFKTQETPKSTVIGDNQIQTLILKVSESETSVFNHFIDLYLQEIRKGGNNQVEILGMKDITQSVFQMALGGQPTFHSATNSLGINRNRYRRGIFDERGQYAKESEALSNSNLLLATWFDLILFKQKPGTLYDIIDKLVTLNENDSYLQSIRTADKQQMNGSFYLKMMSYFHLIVLNSTKNLYAQSLSKINYLLVLSQQILVDPIEQPRKSFKDLKLKSFEIKTKGQNEFHENIKLTYDCKSKKFLWREEAMEFLLKKWKVIANVITQVCVKDPKAFYALIFEQCAQLLDQQLSLQVQLINQLMNISQNLIFQGEIKQRESEKCDQIRMNLYSIIQEIIGHPSANRHEQAQQDRFLGINSFANFKSQSQRYREYSFANRQESTQQLSKWSQIINQNIYIYSQYLENLKQIMRLFKNNHLYIALWFNKFHSQTKTLLLKLNKAELQRIFTKFLKEIPVVWDSMVSDQEQKKQRRVRRVQKSKFRNRISSIKTESPLSMNAKKAIVLNYIMKAELELYSHYMRMNTLNGQRNIAEFFEKEAIKKQERSKPQFFTNPLIRSLLLFNCQEQVKETISEVVPIRKNRRQFTSFPIQPRSFIQIQNTRTMNNIDQGETNTEVHELMKVLLYFERPIDIELQLKDGWRDRFGQTEVNFLGEISDYIRYLNEINYMYQFYNWSQEINIKRQKIQLLNGSEFQVDIEGIDSYFKELQKNEQFINELELMKGEKENLIVQEQILQLHKRIKIHNKELYMINQTIFEAEHHYKLLAANLIGRERGQKFKTLLQEVISAYKNSKREKPTLKIIDKFSETSLRKNSSWADESQNYGSKNSFKDAMKDSSSMSKFAKKNLSFLSHFQFTPQYYKISSKIVRLNCLIASFDVDNSIFRNIKSYRVLSKERIDKLAIIGNKFYERLSELILIDKHQNENELLVDEQLLIKTKNVYEKKLLLLMSTLFTLSYENQGKVKRNNSSRSSARRSFSNIPQQHLRNYNSVLLKYSQILRKFIFSRIQENIKRMEERQRFQQESNEGERKENNQFSIGRFVEQVLELSQKRERCGEQLLLLSLEQAIENERNMKFCQQFRKQYQNESNNLSSYQSQQEKVEYLRKRLAYLIMREMYFTLNYDNSFLEEKSVNSKRNYGIYQQRISSFYNQIIKIDYQQYMQRKEQEMKKRSLHLKNYEFKYEKQPAVCPLEKNINQLICCLFNQLLTTYTSTVQYRMFTHNHKPNQNSNTPHQLFHQYCASQYSKKLQTNAAESKPQRKKKEKKEKPKAKDSIVSIFAQIFSPGQGDAQPGDQQNTDAVENQAYKICVQPEEHITVFVYTQPKFQLSQSIKVYLKILADWEYRSGTGSRRVDEGFLGRNLRIEPITEMQLEMMRLNERSLITMLKSQYLQKIQQAKSKLIRMNLLANIEKLYINIDVRHKVFESFKDRILNYQMQKTKIYHQYMDYIRGLKLDVYSHMAGEESLPYIKIIHAVKLLRLNIKKMELEQRVGQEFEKNLQKWNQGIQKNMQAYDTWLQTELSQWMENTSKYKEQKKNLLDIFHAVSKEMGRQNKVAFQKKTFTNSSCKQLPQLQQAQFKPISFSKSPSLTANFFLPQKQQSLAKKISKEKAFRTMQNSALRKNFSQTTKPTIKEKMSIICKSREGPRGLSLKYDISNINAPSQQQIKAGRRTEAFQQSGKGSSVFVKKARRHLSAQKFRSQLEHY